MTFKNIYFFESFQRLSKMRDKYMEQNSKEFHVKGVCDNRDEVEAAHKIFIYRWGTSQKNKNDPPCEPLRL